MKGKKHRLLIYERTTGQRRGLFLVVALLFLALFVLPYLVDAQTAAKLWPSQFDVFFLVLGVLAFVFFLYKLVAPKLAYVQCTERNIRVQTPLYPLVISYRRVTTSRSNQWGRVYPPESLTRGRKRALNRILGETVVILDLKGWPISRSFLRWWIPDVMFSPGGDGLVLWVNDWMALSREISHFTDVRRESRMGPKPEASVYGRIRRGG